MAAINSCKIPGFNNNHIKIKAPISSLSYPQFFRANPSCEAFKLPRLRIFYPRNKAPEQCFRAPRISCLLEDNCEEHKETEHSLNNSQQEAAIDLKLPRRSLLVTFTCDACGARSQRLINRLAYERGLVYVQCSGCSQYHKLVDNLGLVVEYKLHDEIDLDANTDRA
ncbi:dnl-type zinc finger protein [Phtheirospermum japonicum]|uniref:Dnl-type zinc finger protein n=1 Tax=Phtheirospermum japonicum TaxID=374723 RepID=A0A830CT53_9LAMI|nr:dnl-type zinc finger protein [Phtheirospermum japonicum]